MKDIYNTLYNLPENLTKRKPDRMLKFFIENTKNMSYLTNTFETSIDPQFIFFSKELTNAEINECKFF